MTVYLVGAGPGDPGLMTARALELIAAADVIVHDRLIPATALDGARHDAEVIYAGKEGHGPSMAQAEIERLLVERGRGGAAVVRLKGGDPFVFGRGGEEAQALRAAGIEFEVVPGVSAGVAAAAYAGIPVTHRGAASAVAFVTGHEDPDKPESDLDWRALAAFPGTLVVFMGVRQLPRIAQRLIGGGRPAGEPAALVHRGTLPGQRAVVATLETVAAVAERERIMAPALAIFGPVAALRERLAWVERRPLHGRTVAVTRARVQASGLAGRLRALGAEVVQAPVIRTRTIPGPLPDLEAFDLVCFTSPNGVDALFERVEGSGNDSRAFGTGSRIGAIGPGTARALAAHGIRCDLMPGRAVAEALVQALAGTPVRRALIARALQARDTLPDALRERGAEVEVLSVYETVIERLSEQQLEAVAGADFITFTSASTVRNFLQSAGGASVWLARERRPRLASIGPVTSDELRANGMTPDIEAARHDPEGLIEAILAA
ncbi:MAG: uroporphyrinogen-III C-methyltransferase [Solirubrobacteraceae bacterium]